jgi:hypothetical protein
MVSMLLILGALSMGLFAWAIQIRHGLEYSGINHPIAWGVYITNFVFWIGIGHAGTLISAVLYLVRASFRNSIYRASEAMTVFAVMTAGLFPLIHLGRVWFGYWLLPYPNQRELWVNFKSPLLWDVFAISTYMSVSIAFFVMGLIPDLAAVRDESKGPALQYSGSLFPGHQSPVAALYAGVPAFRRNCHPAGFFRSFDCFLGFCHVQSFRVAFNHLCALFRGRGHLFRLRDGFDDHDTIAAGLSRF